MTYMFSKAVGESGGKDIFREIDLNEICYACRPDLPRSTRYAVLCDRHIEGLKSKGALDTSLANGGRE